MTAAAEINSAQKIHMERKTASLRRIAVYLGATLPRVESYIRKTAEFGAFLGERGTTVVYGGTNMGLMKVLADSVREHGGRLCGVFPSALKRDLLRNDLDETILVDTLSERKAQMLKRVDAAIALPGSFGTWDELFDALSLQKIGSGVHTIPIGILNINGYFDPLLEFIRQSIETGFTDECRRDLLKTGNTPEELFLRLEGAAIRK